VAIIQWFLLIESANLEGLPFGVAVLIAEHNGTDKALYAQDKLIRISLENKHRILRFIENIAALISLVSFVELMPTRKAKND